jgi:hypothetical protein
VASGSVVVGLSLAAGLGVVSASGALVAAGVAGTTVNSDPVSVLWGATVEAELYITAGEAMARVTVASSADWPVYAGIVILVV